MQGFDEALDGQVDVADQLSRYLLATAREHGADDLTSRHSFDDRSEFETHRASVRETFLDAIGGVPDRPADPDVDVTGRVERDGFTVERLAIESRADFHVTANCYVPDGEGPHPGILFLCGHSDPPKEDGANQRACADLALNGFVTLILDPVCQGERTQYDDPDTGEAIVSGGGGTFPHIYAGQQCFYAGLNLARYVIADARSGLDYLVGREGVDGDWIGVTGTSGGGTQTMYLGLADDRIDVAAPCCSVSTRYERLKSGSRTHGEQTIFDCVPAGVDYADLLAAVAPRPVCVGAAASDRYFPIEGVHDTVERLRGMWGLYDAADRVTLVVEDEPHCAVWDFHDGVLGWLCEQLGEAPYEPHENVEPLDPADLHVTPNGNVRDAYPEERTIDDLIRADVAAKYPDAVGDAAAGDAALHADPDDLRRIVVDRLDLARDGCDLHPRTVVRTTENGLDVEKVWFRTERDPDAVVAGVLVSDPDVSSEAPAVACYEHGAEELPDRREDVAALARRHGKVLVFDPRGVGAVRNREIPVPNWVEEYYGVYGTECKLANDALLLGTSLFGMRVFDVGRAAEFLRARTDRDCVSFVGNGVGAYHALYAAVAAERVDSVAIRDMGPSFRDMATTREYPFRPQLTAFDVLDCDVPQARQVLEARGVDVTVDRGDWDVWAV